MKKSRILWSKTFWGLKPIFGYGTDFLNGHTGKSLSQSCQSTAIKLQHRAACVSSQHNYQLQPHTSPTDQPKLKTQIEQRSDLGAPPNSRLLHNICYRHVSQTWRQLPAHGENQIICVTGKKSLGNNIQPMAKTSQYTLECREKWTTHLQPELWADSQHCVLPGTRNVVHQELQFLEPAISFRQEQALAGLLRQRSRVALICHVKSWVMCRLNKINPVKHLKATGKDPAM